MKALTIFAVLLTSSISFARSEVICRSKQYNGGSTIESKSIDQWVNMVTNNLNSDIMNKSQDKSKKPTLSAPTFSLVPVTRDGSEFAITVCVTADFGQ